MKKFDEVEISSTMIGVDITITQKIIYKLLGVSNIWRFIMNTKESSHEADVIKTRLFELSEDTWSSSDFAKVKNMKTTHKLVFKILVACLIPIEGSTDQFSRDHRHFIWYLVNEENINLPGYIFNHLCEYIKDIKKLKKKNVPYVRSYMNCFIRAV